LIALIIIAGYAPSVFSIDLFVGFTRAKLFAQLCDIAHN
jgi:hypothetical protein